ncbi:F-box only protein 28-like [Anopheles ziemanni]|uniref:F-box only protein 28-like n=1 Tax=Anopheles coustani TaxID=139045 RepID=UPI00265B1D98|nr:F-box only protein 28-like [Anopheles coustani]XP_058178141.1 F-box only protein 28-like [Anopheles ziemanni]
MVTYECVNVENTSRPLWAHEVLQELRDISSMAIEHFDENIAGGLKRLLTQQNPHHPVPVSVNPFPNICYYQNELPEVLPVEKFMVPYATVTQTPAPPPPSPPAMAGPSTSGTMISLYCQSGCNSSRENCASIVRINLKARKMRYDINRIDHTMASFKADLRNIRVHMLRQNAEMKDLRRGLVESETKNRELMAKINQFSNDNPQAVALKTELAKDSIKRSIKFIKRAISETEPGLSGFTAGLPHPDGDSLSSAFDSVPFSLGTFPLLSSDEEEFLTPTTTLEDGPSAVKKVRFSE